MDKEVIAILGSIVVATLASPIVAVWKGRGPWSVGSFIFSAIELWLLFPGITNSGFLYIVIFHIAPALMLTPLLLSWLCTYLAYRERVRDQQAGEI